MTHERKEFHICVDGGPCAGKTTALAILRQQLEDKGFRVITVPEAATIAIGSGFKPGKADNVDFQQFIARLQYQHEELMRGQAPKLYPEDRLVFLYDRGLLSGAAYLDATETDVDLDRFQRTVLIPGIDERCEYLWGRYNAVIHLVTAADGALAFYTLENNAARTEDPVTARALDAKTKHAWTGHPHLRVVTNKHHNGRERSFEEKMDATLHHVYDAVGIPVPIEDEDKFILLGGFKPSVLPPTTAIIDIRQTYLETNEVEERVRKRTFLGGSSYYHTIKWPGPNNTRFETEEAITLEEYRHLLRRADRNLISLHKKRHCFLFDNQYFELDVFQGEREPLVSLERERTRDNPTTQVPKFLGQYEDVSHNPHFKNRAIAERSWTM